MKKNNKYLLIPLLSFLCLNNVYAACTQEEIDNFKKIEDKYTVTYDFDKTTKTYTLYLKNPDMKNYVYSLGLDNYDNIKKIDDETIKVINIKNGEYEITITGNNDSCNDTLKTINLNLPKYNPYSEDPLCQGIEEFVLCQPTYDKDIDYETFKSRIETYKKTKDNEDSKSNVSDENTPKEDSEILEYIKVNLSQIIIIIIFLILVIISTVLTIKSIRKSRRLE